jgi:hypothetical protein
MPRAGFAPLTLFGSVGLRLVLPVRFDLKPADEQCGQDRLRVIIRPNADATPRWRNMRVIVGRNIVLTAIGCIHDKGLKWLSS